MLTRAALEAVARDLRGRDEPRFDALIEAMSRLARLVNDHAMGMQAMQGMSDTSRLPAPEVGAGDV
ncbi:hypothetical protein [Rhizobium rhizosphaerae]|nr:hypothetical protein [Xaviernesmea rhizosphaerae]